MVATAWHGAVDAAPAGVARSENVLPIVIASAGHPKDPQTRYQQAVSLRSGGGSWGVIAHELGTDSAAALILIEHHWAVPLRDAIASAGGFRISDGFISPLDLVGIGLMKAEEAKELHALETEKAPATV